LPGAAKLSEAVAGFSARRSLPQWRADVFDETRGLRMRTPSPQRGEGEDRTNFDVVLFVDTFNRYFERENIDAALAVLNAAGYRVHLATAPGGGRPLCCGRTFLAVGKVDEARREAERTLAALAPWVERGVPVLGLEPSCIFTFRDEIPALIKSVTAQRAAGQAMLFEEFLAREARSGKLALRLAPMKQRALLHGHCHQKSFDAMSSVETVLKLVPGLEVETIESSCCGMAGAFGYHADTIEVSRAMGELSLLPAVRQAPDDAIIVADGTSCRHQIHDGAGRAAMHVVRALAMALPGNSRHP
jgi:Fe-S oxidoreductase